MKNNYGVTGGEVRLVRRERVKLRFDPDTLRSVTKRYKKKRARGKKVKKKNNNTDSAVRLGESDVRSRESRNE